MGAIGKILGEPSRRLRRGIRPRDPDRIEAVLTRGLRQGAPDRRAIVQKSRSA
jgi:hypothetical protein